jgi:hypothetical protein
MEFRDRLMETLRAIQPVLDVPGVMVIGSEVPTLLQGAGEPAIVVSQDVDVGVAVGSHEEVKRRLGDVVRLRPAREEPSVWLPTDPALIEVNFVGIDASISDIAETYVLEDPALPLLVFGPLSLLSAAERIDAQGVRLALPRPAGLLLEKLVTERTGEKGDRDLLVVLALLLVMKGADVEDAVDGFSRLSAEQRTAAVSNLTVLSLMDARPGMPDPSPHRRDISRLLDRLEAAAERAR